jgi:hypothetical protein
MAMVDDTYKRSGSILEVIIHISLKSSFNLKLKVKYSSRYLHFPQL